VSKAFRCEVCDGAPSVRLERVGDAVVTWSCQADVVEVFTRMWRERPDHAIHISEAKVPDA
jgi:hypothetical protein